MSHLLKIEVNWSEYEPGGSHPAQALLDRIHARLNSLKGDRPDIHAHLEGGDCSYVYWGCGSCGDGGARVDAYCTSSGGSQPDYSWCEAC